MADGHLTHFSLCCCRGGFRFVRLYRVDFGVGGFYGILKGGERVCFSFFVLFYERGVRHVVITLLSLFRVIFLCRARVSVFLLFSTSLWVTLCRVWRSSYGSELFFSFLLYRSCSVVYFIVAKDFGCCIHRVVYLYVVY